MAEASRQVRRVLMCTIDRRVHRHVPVEFPGRVRLGQQPRVDPVPGAVGAEPAVPLPDRLPRTERHGQASPRNARTETEDNALDHLPVLAKRPPTLTIRRRQQRLGTKFRVEDIQQPILDAVDLVIDYGLRKYHLYRRSSTIIDFSTMEVVRIGTCYELISDIMVTQFGITLPADPGREVLPSGHLREQAAAT